MHESVLQWVKRQSCRETPGAVLELGSLDVNGSVRGLFPNAQLYVGIDCRRGRGVDVQAWASSLPFPDGIFDLVVTTEMLEHDLAFWWSLEEARRVMKPGAVLLVTCRGFGFPKHDHPGDYYRFTPEGLGRLLWALDFFPIQAQADPQFPGVFAVAAKEG